MSDLNEEEEDIGDDFDEIFEEEDIAIENSDLESNVSINSAGDDVEEEDSRGDTSLEYEYSEDGAVEGEDGKEDDEESEEEEEIKITDEEEEEEEEVVEYETKPKYKTIFGKPQNPNMLTIIKWRNKGYPIVRFTGKDIRPREFDMTIKRNRDTVRSLIKSPMKGSVWKVPRKEEVKTTKIQKQEKTRRRYAPGFRLPSDEEEEVSKISSVKNETMIKGRGKKRQRKRTPRRSRQVLVVLTANPMLQKHPMQRKQFQKWKTKHPLKIPQRKQLEHARLPRKRRDQQTKLLLLLAKVRLLLWSGTMMTMTLSI